MADLRVDGIGEVNGRGAGWQGDHPTLRSEDVDLILLEVELQRLEVLHGITHLIVDVDDPLHPCQLSGAVATLFVAPVGSDAVLRPCVHLLRSDLHLDRLAARPDHRGVERLIEVELRRVDVILEPPMHRMPEGMDSAERRPAVTLIDTDHPEANQIKDVVELLAPHDHLLVDAPKVLAPAADLCRHPDGSKSLIKIADHLGDELITLGRP